MALKPLEEYLMILERDGFAGLGERDFRFSSRNGRRLTACAFIAYASVGEDPISHDAPPNRLSGAVKDWLGRWAYPWVEVDISAESLSAGGLLYIDPLTHIQ